MIYVKTNKYNQKYEAQVRRKPSGSWKPTDADLKSSLFEHYDMRSNNCALSVEDPIMTYSK